MRYVSRNIWAMLFVYTLSTQSQAREFYSWDYLYVHDGDTVMFRAPWVPQPIKPIIGIRLNGLDSAEYGGRAQCLEERERAERTKQFVIAAMTTAKKIQVTIKAWDKYGGRILGDVILDGRSLSQQLLDLGYARPYHGEKKQGWCTTMGVKK